MNDMTEQEIWAELLRITGGNKYGAAGLMGNLKAESNINSQNLQGSYEKKFGTNDSAYTRGVDSGSYNNFVHDSAGYGLAQWTYHSRKQGLLDYARRTGQSIGSTRMQLQYLEQELKNSYPKTYNALRNARSVQEASDAFMLQYERPANQSSSARNKRASYGTEYLNSYSGVGPASGTSNNTNANANQDANQNAASLSDLSSLSDVTLEIDLESVDEICASWLNSIKSVDIGSIDLASTFEPLTSCGVAVDFVSKLKSCLSSGEEKTVSIINIILGISADQTSVDDSYSDRSDNASYVEDSYYGGGGDGDGGSRHSRGKKHDKDNDTDADNKDKDLSINVADLLEKINYNDSSYIDLMTLLSNIDNNSIIELLSNSDYSENLKKLLLASPLVNKELKDLILKMDNNEVQTTLKNIVTDEPKLDNVTKKILYNYTEKLTSLKNVSNGSSEFVKNIGDLFDVTSILSTRKDIQSMTSTIYNSTNKNDSFEFIKTIVDTIAKEKKVTSTELLSNKKYENVLKSSLEDVSKGVGYIKLINNLDNDTAVSYVNENKLKE